MQFHSKISPYKTINDWAVRDEFPTTKEKVITSTKVKYKKSTPKQNSLIKTGGKIPLKVFIYFKYSKCLSSTFSHSGRVQRILSSTNSLRRCGPSTKSVAGIKAPPPACLYLENFWVELYLDVTVGSPLISLFRVI